ncbi:MAG: hypothetical protein KIT72_07460 [Polyangiaceae bacterium]|nr:hypothetical protein [Polyangiaceae bacterium]MCW5790241.1 hypothetical protein [Polyangiaceae bacterium]
MADNRFDRAVRWAALAGVPLLLLIGYLASREGEAPEEPSAPLSSIDATGISVPSPSHSYVVSGDQLHVVVPPSAPPPTPAPAARDLPTAEPMPRSAAPHKAAGNRPRGPCGGLVVRLITQGAEGSTASIAVDEQSRAEIKEVGDTVGGYRVSRIEWDRVWFSSGAGVCSVGIHHGARAAQESPKGRALELVDGGAEGRPAPEVAVPDPGLAAGGVPLEIAEGIRVDNPTLTHVEGFAVKAIRARGEALLSAVKLEDAARGVALRGIKEDSLLWRLGLRDGDLILAVDEHPTPRRDELLGWLRKWLSEERYDARTYGVLVERAGERFTLELVLGS